MKCCLNLVSKIKDRTGAVLVVVAITVPVLVGMAALAIDIGYVYTTKNELQNVADAAALAAAGELGGIYGGLSYDEQLTYVCDPGSIIDIAQDVAGMNQAGSMNITINPEDIIIGQWDPDATVGDRLTPTLNQPNAVRVIARRDGDANGPITTFFATIFTLFGAEDPEIVNVSAVATAALMGPSIVNEGGLPIPVGIPKYRFESPYCDDDILLHPTGSFEGCAGWHTYDSWPSNANKLKGILYGLKVGSYKSPETVAGKSEFSFIGGDVASAFGNMEQLYEANKNSDGEWQTAVVVYDDEGEGCANPNQSKTILGVAMITVNDVVGPPDKTIKATIDCGRLIKDRGDGGFFGTRGTTPGLVQ